jgi:beta-mannosidase
MLRIWGGGVYESDELYTLCDELGILVWQDICLACGDYPAHLDNFADEICAEVRENLERLRCHPSLVVVAGNNEDYQVADEELGYDARQPEGEWRKSSFPSRWLYEKIFPGIVREVCNGNTGAEIGQAGTAGTGVVYWPGSPWGGEDSTDRTVGDIHQWNSMFLPFLFNDWIIAVCTGFTSAWSKAERTRCGRASTKIGCNSNRVLIFTRPYRSTLTSSK